MEKLFKISVYIYLTVTSILNSYNYAQYSIKGNVNYSDNNSPLSNDKVYILYYNYDLYQPVYLDSADLNQNGVYSISTFYNDSVLICVGKIKIIDYQDHVQTYYQSTIDWQQAQKIYPPDNPSGINISVDRIIPQSGNSFISGTITTIDSNNNIVPLAGATVVAESGSVFRKAIITDSLGNYSLDSLSTGTYTILATKIGYSFDSASVSTNGNSITSNHPKLRLTRVHRNKQSLTSGLTNLFKLFQNFPNPFNPTTKIKFSISPSPSKMERGLGGEAGISVTLNIYDLLGHIVITLINEKLQPGTYEIEWNASGYSSGIYFYELVCENQKIVNRMLLIK